MAIESMVVLGLVAVFLGGLSWYASTHRAEDKDRHQLGKKHESDDIHVGEKSRHEDS